MVLDWSPTSDRFHAARGKQFTRERKNTGWTPFLSLGELNGPTERPQNKVLLSCLMEMDITVDGGIHIVRTNTLLLRCCVVACARGYRSYIFDIWMARSKILDDKNTGFHPRSNTGTERTAINSLVPFRSAPQGRTKLRHALIGRSHFSGERCSE